MTNILISIILTVIAIWRVSGSAKKQMRDNVKKASKTKKVSILEKPRIKMENGYWIPIPPIIWTADSADASLKAVEYTTRLNDVIEDKMHIRHYKYQNDNWYLEI